MKHERMAVSIREAAAAVGVCERTIWKWIKMGELPSTKIGGRRFIPIDAFKRRLKLLPLDWEERPDRRTKP